MKQDKFRYKLAIKTKERDSRNEFSDSFNDALSNKDMDGFWKTWKSKFGKKQLPVSLMVCVIINPLHLDLPRYSAVCVRLILVRDTKN